jgi:sugar transferase EpsL
MYKLFGKRAIDIVVSAVLLVLLSPVYLAVAVTVSIGLGRPVLFRQQRPGFRGRPFIMWKFRTMSNARGKDGKLLGDAERITRLGRIMRGASLDELPELFNVLRGEMSLVGPRPLIMAYLSRYTPFQARRHDVIPGITGWTQVNGRNSLDWERKFELDVWYVDNQSFLLDLRILALTVIKVFDRKGISQEGFVSASEFMGSPAKEQESVQIQRTNAN